MNSPWRKKTLTLCVSAAVAQWAVGAAWADSAVGVNTTLGNALNPNGLTTIPVRDPEVVDAVPDERTPTGKLIGWPLAVPNRTTTASGWTYNGQAEIGGMGAGGNTDSWWYNQYKDLPTGGLYLNNFYFQADQTDRGKGYFVEALGGGVGYRDQFEGVNFGRYNDWKVKVFYNETPHLFTSTYRNLWSGVGTGNLTLDTLQPGGTAKPGTPAIPGVVASRTRRGVLATPAVTAGANSAAATRNNIANAVNALEDSELSLVRNTGGLTFDKWITNAWKFYGAFTQENRTGARPFGAVFGGGGGGGSVEVPESIDYDTNDIVAALRFDDGVNNLNLQANVSLFRNNLDTMTFENPLYVTTNTIAAIPPNVLDPTVFTTGQYAQYPDNNYYNLRAEYGRSMPQWYHSRLTATVSLSKYKQDDNLVPWTQNDMKGLSVLGVSAYNQWNTPASLTKQSADAEIDTQLFDIGLVMRPTQKLDVNGKIRYYKTDNKTDFLACNPLTGQWGRLINDGSGGAFVTPNLTVGANPAGTTQLGYNGTGCDLGATEALNLAPSAGNVNLRNIPFQYSKTNVELGGEYRIARGQLVNAKYEYERYSRDYRERDQTWENMVKLGYVNRAFQFGTLRASIEYGERRGDTYNPDPYEQFYSGSLGPIPLVMGKAAVGTTPAVAGTNLANWIHAGTTFRKYDLADRDRLALDLRLDLIALHDLDVGLTGQYRDLDYPDSDYGRSDHQSLGSGTLDVNWQPSSKLGITGWYTYQQSSLSQYGVQANGCALGTNYIFYSDGFVANVAPGAAAPTRTGVTIVDRVQVNGGNWQGLCETPAANSPLMPTSRTWLVDNKDSNNAVGLSARYDLGFARLELDGTYINGTTSADYSYNAAALTAAANDPANIGTAASRGLTANPATPAVNQQANQTIWADAGTGMPDQDYNQQIINFNVVVPVTKSLAIRFLYRYEQGSISDWHYAGVAGNPVPSFNTVSAVVPATATTTGSYGTVGQTAQSVYLDSGPQDYHTNTFGLLVQVTF